MVIKKTNQTSNKIKSPIIVKYKKIGMIGAGVVAVAVLGMIGISALNNRTVSVASAISSVSVEAVSGAELRIAVVRMDAVLSDATVLKSLRRQREGFEKKLRDKLTAEQKSLEKEKAEIEKSQDVLSQEALQRRVGEYQKRVSGLQRSLTENSQAIDGAYQKSLAVVQEKHLGPVIEGIIAKKNLSLVIDGRFARTGKDIKNLDITPDVVSALDKKISNIKMETPKGL